MLAPLAHRGPDSEGIWSDPRRGDGRSSADWRSSTSSPAGAQPMVSADGRWVIVVQRRGLRLPRAAAELERRGVRLRTSDTEVLLELGRTRRCGEGARAASTRCTASRCGTAQRRELWLARDPVGEKPLYVGRGARRRRLRQRAPALVESPPASSDDRPPGPRRPTSSSGTCPLRGRSTKGRRSCARASGGGYGADGHASGERHRRGARPTGGDATTPRAAHRCGRDSHRRRRAGGRVPLGWHRLDHRRCARGPAGDNTDLHGRRSPRRATTSRPTHGGGPRAGHGAHRAGRVGRRRPRARSPVARSLRRALRRPVRDPDPPHRSGGPPIGDGRPHRRRWRRAVRWLQPARRRGATRAVARAGFRSRVRPRSGARWRPRCHRPRSSGWPVRWHP